MNMKTFKFLAIMLALAGSWASCNKNTLNESNIDMSKIDFSNIDDLHAQPLPVIQKCVEGEWNFFLYYTWGVMGVFDSSNTFANITKDSIVVTGGDDFMPKLSFSYSWKKKETLSDYTTYVMWNNAQNSGELFFDNIRNDTLCAFSYKANPGGYCDTYYFYRIK